MVRDPLLVYADGPDGPLPDPREIAAMAGLTTPRTLLGWVIRAEAWMSAPPGPTTTVLVGPGTRAAVAASSVTGVAARLSGMPPRLGGDLRPDVAVVGAVADGHRYRFANSVGWAPTAARCADGVVLEVWPGPPALDAPEVDGRIIGVYERREPPDPPPEPAIGAVEREIGRLVASLISEGSTVQWGPGTIGAAVIDALEVPVRVSSGLVTDELVSLTDRGLLVGTARAAYLWGGASLRLLREQGRLVVDEVDRTHDLSALSRIPQFVAVNTALEVGLDGAVNVERVGGRTVAGPGGHPDFCAAASRSPGGCSIIALRSSFGARSGIVAVPEVVSTPRSDVDVVVTEHGIAHLRGLDDRGRAEALVRIAAPEHQASLRDAIARRCRPA